MRRASFSIALTFALSFTARALAQAPATPPPPAEETPSPNRPEESAPKPADAPLVPVAVDPRVEAEARQEERLRALEARAARDEKHIRTLEERFKPFKSLRLEGFIQPQLLVQTFNSAGSPNVQANGRLPEGIDANDTIAKADGTTTNGTFFRVRRARMRTFYETDVMRMFLQLDALPAGGVGPGIGTILRNAEATGIVRWSRQVRTEITAGLFFTPFRAELLEASVFRPFIERTWFIQNAFPTERDYGVHAKTIALRDRLVVDFAVVNGQRLGERTFVALPDLNRSKDTILYTAYTAGPVTLGASAYLGRGQIVDATNLRYKEFAKRAANLQASATYRVLPVGDTRLSSELTFARNLDTGLNYAYALPQIRPRFADAVATRDHRALYVRVEQDLKRHVTLGYRYDMYTPDVTIKNNARDTHAWLAVWKISPNLRWMNELGWVIDNVHPAGTPPPSKHIVYFSTVLQAMF